MAEKIISTRQKQKYDTSTNWATNNIVLLAGEIGIESDTNKFKIGNGTSAWNELDYVGSGDVVLYSTTGQNTDGAMTQKAVTDAIPTTLADLNEDSSHRTVTDAEKNTWNAKSDFSGSYNDLTNKPTISTININGQPQPTLNFDSDPQTQIDNIANNTTKIANSYGGFVAGEGASASIDYMPSMNDGGVAIGKGAQVVSGGGAIGDSAYCYDNGFAGGKLAKATNSCIQLGWGTNDEPKSLQIYGDNIYNASTHTLTVQNFSLNGGTISYDSSTDTFTI